MFPLLLVCAPTARNGSFASKPMLRRRRPALSLRDIANVPVPVQTSNLPRSSVVVSGRNQTTYGCSGSLPTRGVSTQLSLAHRFCRVTVRHPG
jgi:hypothetical protein